MQQCECIALSLDADVGIFCSFAFLKKKTDFMKTYLNLQYSVRAPLEAAACIFFIPFFTAVYILEWLVLQTMYVLKEEILLFLGLKSAVYNQERFQIKSACTVLAIKRIGLN